MNADLYTTPLYPFNEKHILQGYESSHQNNILNLGQVSMPRTNADSNNFFCGTEGKHGESL